MPADTRAMVSELTTQLEELWTHFDTLYDGLQPTDWSRPHGKDWTYADLLYHMTYCDREAVAMAVERGRALPASEQVLCTTFAELAVWNARKFAERPANETVEQSLTAMRQARDAVRRVLSGLNDDELHTRESWFLFRGWGPAYDNLAWCRAHTWNEFMQFRILLGRDTPVPSAAVTHAALGFDLGLYELALDRALARTTALTVVMAFSDEGVGPFTLRVADGTVKASEGRADAPDLVMTQSAVTFMKTIYGLHNPVTAIQNGEIQVSDFDALEMFAQLFPLPASAG